MISKLIIPRFIAEYRLFGPHGPREPGHREGDSLKVVLGIVGVLRILGHLFYGFHSMGTCFLLGPEGPLLLIM